MARKPAVKGRKGPQKPSQGPKTSRKPPKQEGLVKTNPRAPTIGLAITIDETVPGFLAEEIAPIIEEYSFLVPSWCRSLTVRYGPASNVNHVAFCQSDPEYRQAKIMLHPQLLTQDEDFRRHTIVHEMMHIPLMPMSNYVYELIEDFWKDDPETASHIMGQFRKAMEGSTEDLSYAFLGIRPEQRMVAMDE